MNKPYIQKAYEKFAMMTLSIMSHFDISEKKTDGLLGMMEVKGGIGGGGMYLVILGKDEGITPVAKLLSASDAEECEPVFESLKPMTKLFWGTIGKEKRILIDEFGKSLKMPEFEEWYPVA